MLKIYSKTDAGLIRDNNEDFYFTDSAYGLVIVADGAGGHDHGEIASRLAVESCYQYLTREDYLEDTTDITQTLIDSITFANQQVIEYKKKHMPESDMGTTLSCVHVGEKEINFAWMGDSRIYLIDPLKDRISQLSIDHTLYQEMVDRGEIGQSFKKSILSRMLGNNAYSRPDGDKLPLESGNLILVCTDGYSDLISEEKTLDAIKASGNSLEGIDNALIDLAKGEGGRDNITVSLALFE
jgi:serine/threonine protein phosphatase PrpC